MAKLFHKTYYTTPDSSGAYEHKIMASQIYMSAANNRKKYQRGLASLVLLMSFSLKNNDKYIALMLCSVGFHSVILIFDYVIYTAERLLSE